MEGYDFYAGRLGKGAAKCRITNRAGWDIRFLPDQVAVPADSHCLFQFEAVEDMIAKLGPEAARQRTYAYWWLWGTKFTRTPPRLWGAKQARLMLKQVQTYREWVDGRVLFVDIEEPLINPEGTDTWEECTNEFGVLSDVEGCAKNRAVLNGFLEYVARIRAQAEASNEPDFAFESGVYTSPKFWNRYFGADYVPQVKVNSRGSRLGKKPRSQKEPFVLWITGCGTSDGIYDSTMADDIRDRHLFPIVHQTTLGGSRSVWWQYHVNKPDFNVTDQDPAEGFAPVSSAVIYNCTCEDPTLTRPGAYLLCPPVNWVPLETLEIPSDGSAVTTEGTYRSSKTFRIEVSGTYRWGVCDPANCPDGLPCNYERYGDAEYLTDDCWTTYDEDFFGIDISVVLNGEHVDWGSFESDHVYSLVVAGKNAPFSFEIADCTNCYDDNEGSLTVTIYELSR